MSGINKLKESMVLVLTMVLLACRPPAVQASEGEMSAGRPSGMAEETRSVLFRGAVPRAEDRDKSGGLVCEWISQTPKTETVYTAGGGQITWTPVLEGGQVVKGTLTLHDAVINSTGVGIQFPVPVEIKVEGENRITSESMGIYLAYKESGNNIIPKLSVTGSGSLIISSQGDGIQVPDGITVDSVRLEIQYGAPGTSSAGMRAMKQGSTIEIKNSPNVKIKSNSGGVGSNSCAIHGGQNVGQVVRIVNSRVIAVTENGSAINAISGKIEMVSSDIRAVGKTDQDMASGTLVFNEGTMDGGTLFLQNNGADLEIPSVPTLPLKMSNDAVLYSAKEMGLPLAGDLVWYVGCSYDEVSDQVTKMGRGFVFGDVVWNASMGFGAGSPLTVGYAEKEAVLTIPEGITLDIPEGSGLNVGNSTSQPGSRLVNRGTVQAANKGSINIFPNAALANHGAVKVLSGGSLYNYYDTKVQKGGRIQNYGSMAVSGMLQNQSRLENTGTIDSPGSFYTVKLSNYESSIDNKGSMNGFVVEMHSGLYVYTANGKTILRARQMLNLGQGAMSSGSNCVLKVLDGAKLTVEEGAVIDAKSHVTKDTVADYINLSDTLVIKGKLLLPEDILDEALSDIAGHITGSGTVNIGTTEKYIITVNISGKPEAQFVESNGTVNLPEKPVRDGYNFIGWYVKEGDTLKIFDLKTQIQQSAEIVAKWIIVNGWTLTLAIDDWVYGDTARGPRANAKCGKVYFKYCDNANGVFSDTVPEKAGNWYVKAFVDGTGDYTGLESKAVSFWIRPKIYSEGGGIVISKISSGDDVKKIVIRDGGKKLDRDRDYTVSTVENGDETTVTIVFRGNYSGTAVRKYRIAGDNPESPEKPEQPEKPVVTKADVSRNTILLNKKVKVVPVGTKLQVAWGKVSQAQGYDIYAEQCGKKLKLVKSVKGNKKTDFYIGKIGKRKISKKDNYKVQVQAYRVVKGEKEVIAKSFTLHVAGKSHKKYTNAKSIQVSKTKITIKKGASKKLKAKTTKQSTKKKLYLKKHVATYRYFSTNKRVASVSASGTVKGKGKGTCTIYIVAANGVKKGVKVTVK